MMFATLAFRLSFDALTEQAILHGVTPDTAWMFATLVDGGALVGTVGVLAARWAGRRSWPYWATTLAFTALSLIFNIAHSDGTPIGIAIAVTPPIALVVSIELLVRLLPTPPTSSAQEATTEIGGGHSEQPRTAPAPDRTEAPLDLADLLSATEPFMTATNPATPADVDKPLPLAAVFTAPPIATDLGTGDEGEVPAASVPREAVTAYRRLLAETGKRPTAEAFGAALKVRRSRGGELRALVEENLGLTNTCTVTFP